MHTDLKILQKTLTALANIIILFGFTESANLVTGNWYQQYMPNIGNKQIMDITFLDSLTGYAVATGTSDSSYILKTINGGDNWQIIHRQLFTMAQLQFLNENTGYAGGGYLYKTTDGGFNWSQLNTPGATVENMYVLNQDTILYVWSENAFGGVFRTTNGGVNWTATSLFSIGGNPDKIYMFNKNIGFASSGALYKTSNSGLNWNRITGTDGFGSMNFIDSLTGWKTYGAMKKTVDGGLTWVQQTLPSGGIIINSGVGNLSVLNLDTLWAVGQYVQYPNLQSRGIILRTTNGGQMWLFQIPDTSVHLGSYAYIQFLNAKNGWAYDINIGGIHTTNGGDPVWLTGIEQISNQIPKEFKLFQNYPNPFNPSTNIKYQITASPVPSKGGVQIVKLIVYDITGKEITTLVNQNQNAGTYQVDFSGNNLSSGVYFYQLTVSGEQLTEEYMDTKKMILLK